MKRRALAERRRMVGFSQEDLAAELGVDRTTVIRWEAGESEPQPWHRPRLAKALKVPVEELARLLDGAAPPPQADPAPAIPVLPVGSQRARELYSRGYGLLGHDDRQGIEAAAALLERAIHRDPTFAGAIAARGYTSWRKYFAGWADSAEALGRALRDVQAALDADPGSIIAHVTYIRVCWDLGWHERALDAGRSIYLRNPDSLDASLAFARALTNAGMADVAMPLIDSVLADDPMDMTAVKLRIWCLMLLGRAGDAGEYAAAYLTGNPSDANTRWAVALAAYHQEDTDLAIRVARAAVDADPQDVTAWTLLGYLHRLAGDASEARRAWTDALDRLAPAAVASSRRAAWLANILAAAGDADTAVTVAEQLRAAHSGNGYILYRLAHVYAELDLADAALETLRAAVDSGFLSAQLLRREQDFGLSGILALGDYPILLRRLDDNVQRCRRAVAADLPALAPRPEGTGT